jgi:hypothetical protein
LLASAARPSGNQIAAPADGPSKQTWLPLANFVDSTILLYQHYWREGGKIRM